MPIVTQQVIEGLSPNLADADFIDQETWVGVSGSFGDQQEIIFNGWKVDLPVKVRFPVIRYMNSRCVLIVGSRTARDSKNAWIIENDGVVRSNFYAGDAVADVIVAKDFIVVTYFDESYGGTGIESGRVAIFDREGEYLYGYRDSFGTVDVFDCYAASLVGDNKIIFFPYTEFPLVMLDLNTCTEQVWETPAEVAGADAISKSGDRVYFYSPYGDETGIYQWQIGAKTAKRIVEHPGCIRGLRGGRFLALRDSGYTIITLK